MVFELDPDLKKSFETATVQSEVALIEEFYGKELEEIDVSEIEVAKIV